MRRRTGVPFLASAAARACATALIAALLFSTVSLSSAAGAAPTPAPTPVPRKWDPQIEPIAKAVETLRGLKFDHPVAVRFLTEADFVKRQRSERSKLSASDKAELTRAQSQLRALGLIGQGVDLFDASNDISSSDVLAYYDPRTKRVTVRGKGEIGVTARVTLAHELTHALQDQHFNLLKIEKAAAKQHAQTTARAVIEGDAVRIQNLYQEKLSSADQQTYLTESQAQSDKAQVDIKAKAIPEALVAFFEAPYAFGPTLMQVADSKLDGGIDGLFRKVPTNDSAYLTPSTLVDGATFATVGTPAVTKKEKVVGQPDVFGSYALYVVLASRLGPAEALTVADGWGGDAMITIKRAGQTCLRARFVGRDANRTAAIGRALQQWGAAMPAGAATVEPGRSGVTLTACDTGAASSPTPHDAAEATTFASSRDAFYGTLLKQGASSKLAECTADGVVRDPAFAPLLASPDAQPDDATLAQLRTAAQSIASECTQSSQS